jgi:hypothetical protein
MTIPIMSCLVFPKNQSPIFPGSMNPAYIWIDLLLVILFPFAIWVMMIIMNSFEKEGGWIPLPTIICSFITGIMLMVFGFWNVVVGIEIIPFLIMLSGALLFLFSLNALTINRNPHTK